MAVTRINNNQISDASAGNAYVGINAASKLQAYSITSTKLANNLTYGSDLTITGNLTIQGNTTTVDTTYTTIEDPVLLLASNQTGSPAVDIGFIGERGTSNNIAFVWDESATEFVTAFTSTTETNTTITISSYANLHTNDANIGGNLTVNGTTSYVGNVTGNLNVSGNIAGGNLLTPGLITATGNITGGNLITGAQVIATGNITSSANVQGANVIATANLVSAGAAVTGNISGGNVIAAANVVSVGAVHTGNVTGGNLLTAGQVVATGNITSSANVQGANVIATANLVSVGAAVSGNITGGNLLTGGRVVATGNIVSSANIAGGNLAVTGAITSATIETTGNVLVGGNLTVQGNIQYINVDDLRVEDPIIIMGTGPNGAPLTTDDGMDRGIYMEWYKTGLGNSWIGWDNSSGNLVAAADVIFASNNVVNVNSYGTFQAGNIYGQSAVTSGNITGGNLLTGGLVSATGNITSSANIAGANIVASANLVSVGAAVSGNITGGNLLTGAQVIATGNITSSANISGGNIVATANLVSVGAAVSGNITGGNLLTAGQVSATGNITGGNLVTPNLVSATTVTATGNVTGANVNTSSLTLNASTINSNAARITVNSNGSDVDFAVNSDATANVLYVDAGTGTVSIGSSTQTTNAAFAINATNSFLMPVGNTAQRPGVGVTGMLRFNSTLDAVEVYDTDSWTTVGTPSFTVITDQQFSGDGVTVAFTLSAASTTNSTIVSINGVVQIPTLAYSVSSTTLTFTEAPQTGDLIDVRVLTTTTQVTAISNSPGNAIVQPNATSAIVEITGDLNPVANVTYNLGSATSRWKDLYLSGSSITLGNTVIKNVAGGNTIGFYGPDGTTPATIAASSVDTTTIANGTSNVAVASSGGNVRVNVSGTSNVAVFGPLGVGITGGLELSGNIVTTAGNGVANIGSAGAYFNTVHAKATSAQYADLAEVYSADATYSPGTVLSFGGDKEVTISTKAGDARIAGVVSTNPSYVMNATLNSDHTATVALTGRVPTLVSGPIEKGDMMISAGNGRAIACATPAFGTVIGKALETHASGDGVIEVVVGRL